MKRFDEILMIVLVVCVMVLVYAVVRPTLFDNQKVVSLQRSMQDFQRAYNAQVGQIKTMELDIRELKLSKKQAEADNGGK